MPVQIPLRCKCGSVKGEIEFPSRSDIQRFVCLCGDCQAYMHFLGRPGELLDKNGGTEVIPIYPSWLKLPAVNENIKCVRLSDDGLMRWYAGCCDTPIANTMTSARVPFAGLLTPILDLPNDSDVRDEALGPIRARVNGKFGHGDLPKGTSRYGGIVLPLRTILFLIFGFLKKKNQPSPFFESSTGKPRVEPKVLPDPEYYRLREIAANTKNSC